MLKPTYRYTFEDAVPFRDVQETLILALLATEAVHGSPQVRLDAEYRLDVPGRACEIAADTPAGRDLNKTFVNFARREYGDSAFRVERVAEALDPKNREAHA